MSWKMSADIGLTLRRNENDVARSTIRSRPPGAMTSLRQDPSKNPEPEDPQTGHNEGQSRPTGLTTVS
jgi:hypothetical protein